MSRNMIGANQALFQRLVQHCLQRGVSLTGADNPRWVHANAEADLILKQLRVRTSISFGRYRHLAWLEYRETHFVCLIGFDTEPEYTQLYPRDDVQGFDVCVISEIPIHPRATPLQVKNIVEAESKLDEGYEGHDNYSVMQLFPSIQVFESADPLSEDLVWAVFLTMCVDESRWGGSWIDVTLAASLVSLAQLNVPSLPYQELCRAVLDLDPRSLYMTLYRCLEATYAYDHATKLASALALNISWNDLAAKLDAEMGWRPPELQSLNIALAHAHEDDLVEILDCLNPELRNDFQATAGRAIYKLRNQIVHYRPTNMPLVFDNVDWNRVCNALVAISMDVFYHAYGS
jgi:hypothetical protein